MHYEPKFLHYFQHPIVEGQQSTTAKVLPPLRSDLLHMIDITKSLPFRQPSIFDDRNAVTVHFPSLKQCSDDISSSAFHAAWLWSNAPSNIMIPSGQRIHSPGDFPRLVIRSAIVVQSSPNDNNNENSDGNGKGYTNAIPTGSNSMVTSGPPLPFRSVHPIICNTCDYNGKKSSNYIDSNGNHGVDNMYVNDNGVRWVLIVTFTTSTSNYNYKDEDNEVYYYDLEWLRQWTYDDQSLSKRRLVREVTPSHTFCNKFASKSEDEDNADIAGYRLKRHRGLVHVEYSSIDVKQNRSEVNGYECIDDGKCDWNSNNDAIFRLLDAVFVEGAAIVTNAPDICDGPDTPVCVIGKTIAGSLSHSSLYGSIFHVKSLPDAINIAYTSHHLGPHQDLVYYESKPGLQLLHCFSNDQEKVEGGESFLIDAMAAAYAFREMSPRLFEVLVRCPATFVKERGGVSMTYARPHIVLRQGGIINCDGGEDQIDIYSEIVAVNWAPPFEGPLSIPYNLVQSYYEAYAAFEMILDSSIDVDQRIMKQRQQKCDEEGGRESSSDDLVGHVNENLLRSLSKYAHEHTWKYSLLKGEVLVFNNMRMLHGRHSFRIIDKNGTDQTNSAIDSNYGSDDVAYRHLVGAYTNIDDSLNTYRVWLRQRGEGILSSTGEIPNVGNGTSSALP